MIQRPVIPAESESKNVTNSDRGVAYARGESLSVGIATRSQRSKYSSNLSTRAFVMPWDLMNYSQERQDPRRDSKAACQPRRQI
jgi:hypothetical protein